MELTKPLLTICIPTYNRAGVLQECLESVVRAASAYADQMCVLISDNAGTDETPQTVQPFTDQYPWILYHRNTKNIGAEANYRLLSEMAETEFFWLLGDDDKLRPEAVALVLAKLAEGFDAVVCNFAVYTRDFQHVLNERRFVVEEDEVFESPHALMERFSVQLGFISILVMRRVHFLAAPLEQYLAFASYGHSFMFAAYWALIPRSRTVLIAAPIVGNRADNNSSDWYRFFAVGTARVFEALQEWGYPAAAVRKAKEGGLRVLVLPRLLLQKRDGALPAGLFRLLRPLYDRCPLFWAAVVPVLLIPGCVVRLADWLIARPRRLKRQAQQQHALLLSRANESPAP